MAAQALANNFNFIFPLRNVVSRQNLLLKRRQSLVIQVTSSLSKIRSQLTFASRKIPVLRLTRVTFNTRERYWPIFRSNASRARTGNTSASISRESYHTRPISNRGTTSLDITSYLRTAGKSRRYRRHDSLISHMSMPNTCWRRIRGAARKFCSDANFQAFRDADVKRKRE